MDKLERNRTITIKIDGKNRTIHEDKSKASFDLEDNLEEIKGFEELEEEAVIQSAVAEEAKEEDDFDWILPEIEERPNRVFHKPKYKKNTNYKNVKNRKVGKKPTILPSIVLTIFIAVLLGTSLGVLMLKMVTTDTAMEAVGTPVDDTSPPTTEPSNAMTTTSIALPPITSFVVQGGAFSTLEAAETEATSFSTKGVPAKAVEIDGNAYLFVGVADSLPNAKAVGEQLQSNGIETFSKEVQFSGANLSELNETEKQLLEMAPSFYDLLVEMSSSASLSNTISDDSIESFHTQVSQWESLQVPENEEIKLLKSEVDGAITNLKSYLDTKDSRILTTVQQHLLEFLAKYHSLS